MVYPGAAFIGQQASRYVAGRFKRRATNRRKLAGGRARARATNRSQNNKSYTFSSKTIKEFAYQDLAVQTANPENEIALEAIPDVPFLYGDATGSPAIISLNSVFDRYRLTSVRYDFTQIVDERSSEIALYAYLDLDKPDGTGSDDRSKYEITRLGTSRMAVIGTGNYNNSGSMAPMYASHMQVPAATRSFLRRNTSFIAGYSNFFPVLYLAAESPTQESLGVGRLMVTMTCSWELKDPTLIDANRDIDPPIPVVTGLDENEPEPIT